MRRGQDLVLDSRTAVGPAELQWMLDIQALLQATKRRSEMPRRLLHAYGRAPIMRQPHENVRRVICELMEDEAVMLMPTQLCYDEVP